ncbi:MAG: permease, partial [Methanothrix sp.]|nr:permease [Methanothrix sp.]
AIRSCCDGNAATDVRSRARRSASFAFTLFRQLLPYLLLGAGIGAFIHGFVPQELISRIAGPDNPLAVPAAAVIGVPIYIRAETILPIGLALTLKGMSAGAVLALVIGGAGASIPEMTLLSAIFEKRLLAAFLLTIFGIAVAVGFLANFVTAI